MLALPAMMTAAILSATPACAMVAMESEVANAPLPKGWTMLGRVARGQAVELTFAVRQRGLVELQEALMNVSRPSSQDYGQHLSLERVNALTAPDPAHIEAVMSFLKSHGVEPRAATPNSDFIKASLAVELAESMLGAEYSRLVHELSGTEVSRTIGGYHLPDAVAAAVDFVAPTVHVPGARYVRVVAESIGSASNTNTPKHLRELYAIGHVEGSATNNTQAVTAFIGQRYSRKALLQFWDDLCDGITCGKGEVNLIGDASAEEEVGGIEAMLDIETITGIAGNIKSEFWGFTGRVPDSFENEPFLQWLLKVGNTSDADVPKIFSTSYGGDEAAWSMSAATRLNAEFMKAGARGISILFASGDQGANCVLEGQDLVFIPEGPGSSPYVTTVGGTAPASGFPSPGAEIAVGLSSGGFSDYWPMPDYQKEAVRRYLGMSGLPSASRGYNSDGRAYPDLAAQAAGFVVYTNSQPAIVQNVGGTSCATPAVAGIFALLNDMRLSAGKSTLGFLNPLIYEHAAAFNDITSGSSQGCLSSSDGWPAREGWDAVTGVGTPNFAKLVKVVEALPSGNAEGPPDLLV